MNNLSDSEAGLLRSGLHKLNDGELIALCHLVGYTESFFMGMPKDNVITEVMGMPKDNVITEVMERIGRWSNI